MSFDKINFKTKKKRIMKEFIMWYFIAALLVTALGIYRSIKYRIEQDELSVLSMFLFWWAWLIPFVVSQCLKLISNDKK